MHLYVGHEGKAIFVEFVQFQCDVAGIAARSSDGVSAGDYGFEWHFDRQRCGIDLFQVITFNQVGRILISGPDSAAAAAGAYIGVITGKKTLLVPAKIRTLFVADN